jgi:hypothetical protein
VAIDPLLASVHFRVQSAGQNAEQAVDSLRGRRILPGRVALTNVVNNLAQAKAHLVSAGGTQYAAQIQYLDQLMTFYQGVAHRITGPMGGPAQADLVLSNQGLLLAADPLVGNR